MSRPSMRPEYDYLFKIILIGDYDVGKSSILRRISDDYYDTSTTTIGIDFKIRMFELNDKLIKLQIWDTAVQERFRTITSSYYRGASGIMLVYDPANKKSFDSITIFLREVQAFTSEGVQKMLIGHICNEDAQREVSKERGESFAQENGMRFFEVCLKSGDDIETAFMTLVEDILEKCTTPLKEVDPIKSKKKVIPAERVAKGPDALKVYQKALEEGESDCNLVRIMVMGQENVGKTCLINSLLGKKFIKKHIITEVIAMTRSLVLDETDKTKWKEKEIDHKDEIKEKHENALATKAAEDLQKIEDLSSPKSKGLKLVGPSTNQQREKPSDGVTADEETKQSTTNTNTETCQATASASQLPKEGTTRPQQIGENVIEKIVQVMKGKSIKDNSLRIWDFGGQLIYHSIHRLYMTPESIFVIVFNLLDKLDDLAKVIDSSGNEHIYYMTNLEYLLYWIRSAYTYTKDKVYYTDPLINFPVFIIVGTHCKSLSGIEVKEKLDKIRKAIENQVFKTHVYKEYFAVENNLFFFSSDKKVHQLKKVILETKEKMKRPIPLKWLDLLIAIQKLSEENVTLPLKQVKSMAKKYGILDDETIDVAITYLSDVGEIMYHPTEEALKDVVVIQPVEIVKYIRTVFTIKDPKQWEATLIDDWKKLEKGVLTKRLLKHLWEEFPIFKDDTDEKMFNFFVNLMNKFGLLCQKKKKNTDSDGIAYYAISHLPPNQYSEDSNDDQGNNRISIFHDFHGFLPDYLFHLTITKFIEEFQVESGPEPSLAYEHAELNIDDHHYVRIAVVTINHQRMFKTTFVRRQEPNATDVVEPVPETCKKVLSFLQLVLEGLCCARGIRYKMCIPCCCPAKCQRMHSVTNFNKHTVFCGDFVVSIKRYCRLFGAEVVHGTSSPEQITIQGMTDMQFNALKMDVSFWYDDHKCLTMLKVLFRDHVDNERLSKITKTLDLLNDLVAHGYWDSENITILYDTISITRHFGIQRKIKLPSFPDSKEGTISKQFSYHRQRIMKCGMTLSPYNVTQIDGLLNTPCKDYVDGWSMIIDLEDRQIISKKNMEAFIELLKRLEIYPALNALQDVL